MGCITLFGYVEWYYTFFSPEINPLYGYFAQKVRKSPLRYKIELYSFDNGKWKNARFTGYEVCKKFANDDAIFLKISILFFLVSSKLQHPLF